MKKLREFSGDIQTSEISNPISSLMGNGKGWTTGANIFDNLANEASIVFDSAMRDRAATKQIELTRARNWSNVPFFEVLNSNVHPSSPAPQAAGIFSSGIGIIFLLPIAAVVGTIMARMANEKKQSPEDVRPQLSTKKLI